MRIDFDVLYGENILPANITPLLNFQDLEHLWISFNSETFSKLEIDSVEPIHARHLHISSTLDESDDLIQFISRFKNLETLDFKNSFYPQWNVTADVLVALSAAPVKSVSITNPSGIDYSDAKIYILDLSKFSTFNRATCEYLDFSYNHLTFVYQSASKNIFCPNLKLLDLSNNMLASFDYLSTLERASHIAKFYSQILIINLASQMELKEMKVDNDIAKKHHRSMEIGKTSLKRLNLDFMMFRFSEWFDERPETVGGSTAAIKRKDYVLKTSLSFMFLKAKNAFENVTSINLRHVEIYIELSYFGICMPKIEEIIAEGSTLLFSYHTEKFSSVCMTNTNIKILDISNLRDFSVVPSTFFRNCQKLKFVNISNNRLHFLEKDFMDDFDAIQRLHGHLTIDLSGNPFHCYCHENHTSTMHWIRHTKVEISNRESLTCYGHNEEELIFQKNWTEHEKLCSFWDEIFLAVCGTATFFMSSIFLIFLTHFVRNHRYKLRTWYYKLKLAKIGKFDQIIFHYDTFIC